MSAQQQHDGRDFDADDFLRFLSQHDDELADLLEVVSADEKDGLVTELAQVFRRALVKMLSDDATIEIDIVVVDDGESRDHVDESEEALPLLRVSEYHARRAFTFDYREWQRASRATHEGDIYCIMRPSWRKGVGIEDSRDFCSVTIPEIIAFMRYWARDANGYWRGRTSPLLSDTSDTQVFAVWWRERFLPDCQRWQEVKERVRLRPLMDCYDRPHEWIETN